jgi:ABC-type phosphate transport system substrate-binding protein
MRYRLLLISGTALLLAACGAAGQSATGSAASSAGSPAASSSGSTAPEASGSTAIGDIPDNAVFLTYHGTNPAFSIQYVEGWQVTQQPDGVVIRDKDSSETVKVIPPPSDVAGYITSTDLPTLKAQAGFSQVKRDKVKVGASTYEHLAYHVTSPPDAVTGKQLPLMVDRYYVPGPSGLAIVSLATPNGVDNVDAFRQMIQSFKWS